MKNTQPPLKAAPKLLNAFQSVRPRGENKPSASAVPANVGRAPMKLPGSMPRVLDRNGKANATLAPRAYGSISGAVGSASGAKGAAIQIQTEGGAA